jgi:NADPH-dependent 2,4-dienoyl-CoA reductase/sulfur reductase-like enzyme
MFRRLIDETRPAVAILIDGVRVAAREGDSVAAAMLAAGHPVPRGTAVSGAARAPFCLMGACFDCLVTVDGIGNRQGCMITVREGMRIESLPEGEGGRAKLGRVGNSETRESRWSHRFTPPDRLTSFSGRPPQRGGIGPSLPQPSASPSSETISHPPDLRPRYDVAVVGAGPAGLAAARLCAEAELDTVLFDEQAHPGGQIWRCVTASPLPGDTLLGDDYWRGGALVRAALDSGAHYVPGAKVWGLFREGEVAVSVAGRSRLVEASRIIIATGAMERPFPIPGWTLPGVMTAGGAQILLKSSGLVPQGRTVLAGCGPLLWLIAWQYLNAGVRLDAVLDTTPRANRALALRHAASFAASPYFAKGLRLMRAVRRELRVISSIVELAAQGDGRLESVTYWTSRGREQRVGADTLLLHQGVVPNVNLAMAAGVAHCWNDAQLCFVPVLDEYGTTNVPGLGIAGDGAGIAGAEAAEARGTLAATTAIRAIKPQLALAAAEKAACARLRRFERGRAFLDFLFRPAAQFRRPQGETLACRCEEVTAREIIDTVALGCPGPNQMKAFLRCGMGPCQGRLCGLTVTELMAQARGVPPDEIGYYHLRPPVQPITLAELAGLPSSDAAVKAVARE